MHGNTESTQTGLKTRRFENIVSELGQAFKIHKECGSQLNGVHFELTGERVTECVGGSMDMREDELPTNYQVC
jgi:3-deoxy-7-phosphoheptulonate synthase